MRSAAILALALAGCSAQPAPEPAEPEVPSFAAALDRHLAAIPARDLDAIVATITAGEQLLLILPDGTMTLQRGAYLASHREWFADPAWTFASETLRQQQMGDYGYALVRTSYDPDGDGDTAPRTSLLSLGFRLENGEWRLVHDQNTAVAAPDAAVTEG